MFTTQDNIEKVVLIHIDFENSQIDEDSLEFQQLALSAGATPVEFITGSRTVPHAKFFVGQGKLDEIRDCVQSNDIGLVIFNHLLTPSQERNLERYLQCRVLDRTGLILDIFAQRARTHEGKLQVELAQLHYLSTRLVRGWTHLERQKGGIGLRGPGETQLETDRRLLRDRMKTLVKRLDRVKQQRIQNRRARQRGQWSTVALVGYTNAGKTALFNALTREDRLSADKLFATLDPTLRRLDLPGGNAVILADTVGFIRHLPHTLVDAFRATLEEVHAADLLLHVVDVNGPQRQDNQVQVEQVLREIDADRIPTLRIFNKIDLSSCPEPNISEEPISGLPQEIWLSAKKGVGLNLLKAAMVHHLFGEPLLRTLVLLPEQSKLRASLYAKQVVRCEHIDEEGLVHLTVCMSDSLFSSIEQQKE